MAGGSPAPTALSPTAAAFAGRDGPRSSPHQVPVATGIVVTAGLQTIIDVPARHLGIALQLFAEAVIERLSAAMDSSVLHAMLAMPRISLSDKDGASQAAREFYRVLSPNAPKSHIERDPTSDGWRLRLEKIVHGNRVETVIDHAFLESGDYTQIVATAENS